MRGTKRHDESTAQRQSGPVLEPVTSALSACRVGQRADTSCVRGVGHVATGTCREAEVMDGFSLFTVAKCRGLQIYGGVGLPLSRRGPLMSASLFFARTKLPHRASTVGVFGVMDPWA